ncbi:AlpA family phage regulatory protein [Pseudomonas sp. LS1212]|uniref:helix-turn-helix transcriptional regulator n=1 Tax=Pseudomonas sp. LS1212 TaxID=2972478 RepID=UPI00215CDE03|nr:AlpA family phage regulatory protein [Pseudomonas sp. LS1212]UVJ46221.1 AlpA family phage regulatory protein [Pseudomonas sp. LS1212]
MATAFDPIKNFDDLPNSAIVRLPVVIALVGISRASWWNGIKDGIYPKALQIAPRSVGWRVADIRAVLAACYVRTEQDANAAKAVAAKAAKRALLSEGA